MTGPGWLAALRAVYAAIDRRAAGAAIRAWHDAYTAALGSGRWQGMADVADAYLAIGELTGVRTTAEPKARALYLATFFRARTEGALDGVLRAAEALAAFGDREVSTHCLRAAEELVRKQPDDPGPRQRLEASRAVIAEWRTRLRGTG